jgi:hypothetical protein
MIEANIWRVFQVADFEFYVDVESYCIRFDGTKLRKIDHSKKYCPLTFPWNNYRYEGGSNPGLTGSVNQKKMRLIALEFDFNGQISRYCDHL